MNMETPQLAQGSGLATMFNIQAQVERLRPEGRRPSLATDRTYRPSLGYINHCLKKKKKTDKYFNFTLSFYIRLTIKLKWKMLTATLTEAKSLSQAGSLLHVTEHFLLFLHKEQLGFPSGCLQWALKRAATALPACTKHSHTDKSRKLEVSGAPSRSIVPLPSEALAQRGDCLSHLD